VRNILETVPLLDIKRYDKKAQFMAVFSILKEWWASGLQYGDIFWNRSDSNPTRRI
jgi:hypothetical protein